MATVQVPPHLTTAMTRHKPITDQYHQMPSRLMSLGLWQIWRVLPRSPSCPFKLSLVIRQPTLDIRSERLYDFTPDIQDAMELRALRPSAELVKTMSVRDSQSIRIVTPDVYVECGFHGFLFREMREDESSCVATGELDSLRGNWPRILLSCKEWFSYTRFKCVGPVALFHGVSSLSVDMFRGLVASLWLPHCMGFTCKVVRGLVHLLLV